MAEIEQELCGELTPAGETCNMKKGHSADFHRHREYRVPVMWIIKNTANKTLEEGTGRRELGYAMTRWLDNGNPILIEINP